MSTPNFTLHKIPSQGHFLNVREFPGEGPALMLLHGFPDNLHIYDRLIPYLVAAGRHVVALDFMGFGDSDKPEAFSYSFQQQQTDIQDTADFLRLETFTPVAHDAGSVAAINFLLDYPSRVSGLCLLNSFYGPVEGLLLPELIALFATPALHALAMEILMDPRQLEWLLLFQMRQFKRLLAPELLGVQEEVLKPIIVQNFTQTPSAARAFAAMTADLNPTVGANGLKVTRLREFQIPVAVIWGGSDPYLSTAVAEDYARLFRNPSLHVLPAGHWLQIDMPEEVAKHLLAAV